MGKLEQLEKEEQQEEIVGGGESRQKRGKKKPKKGCKENAGMVVLGFEGGLHGLGCHLCKHNTTKQTKQTK